jgi:hypothetical protein
MAKGSRVGPLLKLLEGAGCTRHPFHCQHALLHMIPAFSMHAPLGCCSTPGRHPVPFAATGSLCWSAISAAGNPCKWASYVGLAASAQVCTPECSHHVPVAAARDSMRIHMTLCCRTWHEPKLGTHIAMQLCVCTCKARVVHSFWLRGGAEEACNMVACMSYAVA